MDLPLNWTGMSAESVQNYTGMTTTYSMFPLSRNVPECSETHDQLFCSRISRSIQAQREAETLDYSNMTQTGWIWTSFGFFAPLNVFGIIGNLLTIIMFSKYIKKTTTSVFIIALAIVDLIVCCTSMPIWLYTLFNEYHGSEFVCKLEKLVYFMAIPLSGGILLVIAIDRFLLIFLSKTNIVTRNRAKLIIIILGFLSLALAIPQALSFTTLYKLDERLIASRCKGSISCNTLKCRTTTEYLSKETWYYLFQSLIISFLIMVISFTCMYVLIFSKVYSLHKTMLAWKSKSSKSMHESKRVKIHAEHATFSTQSSSDERADADDNNPTPDQNLRPTSTPVVVKKKQKRRPHVHTAITLLAITLCFVVAYAPLMLMMYLHSCEGNDDNVGVGNVCPKNDYRRFIWHFYFLNHVTNPIIYSFMNPRFREAILACCGSRCRS